MAEDDRNNDPAETRKEIAPLASKGPGHIVWAWNLLNDKANGVIALLTIILAWSAVYQWRATEKALTLTAESNAITRDAVDLTREQLVMTKALERAHVVIQDIGPLPLINMRRVSVTIKNIGRAEARDVEVGTANNGMGEAPLNRDTKLPCVWGTKGMVMSALGADQTAIYHTPEIEILTSTAQQMRSGKGRLFLWFAVSYSDTVGRNRETFCYAWTGDPLGNWRRCDIFDYKNRLNPDPKTACD